jgi:recombination associated protein RdgC
MPALKGSLSYARFFVDGEVPEDFRERYMRAIRLRAMKPLSADEDASERSGWCVIGEPFELDLRYDNVFYNNFVNLGFRTDRWALPGPLVRAKVSEAERAYREKKGRDRLSKRERAEIKEVVTRKLRKQFVPAMRVIDVSWSIEEGVVRFFNQAAKPGLAMSELFTKTFGLKLIPEAPFTLAERIGLSRAQEKAWDSLEVTQFEPRQEA